MQALSLTPYETERLKKLAKKAGIRLDVPVIKRIKLSRVEKKKIEDALTEAYPKGIFLTKKNGHDVRVYSATGYRALSDNMSNYHKAKKGE